MNPTKIRLKQIEETELSGFISQVIDAQETPSLKFFIKTEDIPQLSPANPEDSIVYYISFPEDFDVTPNIVGSLSSPISDSIIGTQISGASISGFSLLFSAPVPNENFKYTYIATTGNGAVNLLV